jgi:hypothetical protein
MRFPLLMLHIAGGMVGMLSGAAAMIFRKGFPAHILAGRIFAGAMLTMGTCAAWLAILKHEPNNFGGGILTVYLITTGWLTARRKDGETNRFDWAALFIPLTIGILSWTNGIDAIRGGTGEKYGVPAGMHIFLGTVCLLAATGDFRMLLSGGVSGARRIGRHLWRMSFALFIAAGSFFFGGGNRPLRLLTSMRIARFFPSAFFTMSVYMVLTILPLVLLISWGLRVRFAKRAGAMFRKQTVTG